MVLAERALHVDRCTGDLVAPFLPLGQAIGRIGNFLAGDAYGLPTSLPWAVFQTDAFRQLPFLARHWQLARACGF
jgi:prolipoprotein diacylglyceryltransferase